jgi:hypothetical protein
MKLKKYHNEKKNNLSKWKTENLGHSDATFHGFNKFFFKSL